MWRTYWTISSLPHMQYAFMERPEEISDGEKISLNLRAVNTVRKMCLGGQVMFKPKTRKQNDINNNQNPNK